MQSFAQFLELLNDTWTMRFGLNTTREYEPLEALYGYDSMWLAALALDWAEARLQNMTPSLTLGNFQYTGENSTIIKDAIYTSALEVTFIGASVSDWILSCTMQTMRNKHNVPINEYQICLFSIVQGFMKLLPNGDRAAELQFFQYRLNSESEGK